MHYSHIVTEISVRSPSNTLCCTGANDGKIRLTYFQEKWW